MDYNAEVDKKWKCTINLAIDKKEFEDTYRNILSEYRKESGIKGFRKGKAPIKIIEKKYGPEIENETINKIVPVKYREIIMKEDIHPITQPLITDMKKDESNINIEMTIDTYPDVTIDNYRDIEIELERKTADEDMVEDELKRLSKNQADMEGKEDALSSDDVAIIDLKVFDSNGDELEELETKDYSLEIGSPKVYPEISKSVEGKKPGDSVEVSYTYPDDFDDEKLQGREVLFKIDIKKGFRRVLPEMDEKFAENFGMKNMKQMKEAVKNSLQNQFDKDYEAQKEEKVIDSIIEKNPFEVPDSLINAHLKSLVNNIMRGEDTEITEEKKKVYGPYAEWRAKREIILASIIKEENLDIDDEKVEEEIAKFRNHPNKQMREYAENQSIRKDIKTDMLYNKAR
ncbi:MAG: trigger factor, partial [candidate division WOR-3 bacterium]|nr:trigger factor [candidate division WOR-3 bacterium]